MKITPRYMLASWPFFRAAILVPIAIAILAACSQPAPGGAPNPTPASPTGAQPVAAAPKVVEVKVGAVGTQAFSPLEAAKSLGLFEKEGLRVEIVEHRGGAEAAQALVGGGIEFFLGDVSHAARLNQQGQGVRVVAGGTERHSYTLVGAPGAKTGVEALKGQKIGITSPGSQTDNSLRWLLKKNGFDPDKDVELVAIGAGTPMMAAVQNKQVYAGMVVEPFTSQLVSQDYAVVYDFYKEVAPFEATAFMVKQSWLKDNSDVTKRFLRAYLAAVKRLNEDASARNELMKKAYPQLDAKVAELAATRLTEAYSKDGKIQQSAVDKVLEFDEVARNVKQSAPPLTEYADFSYLP